jgi:hypothetical protein
MGEDDGGGWAWALLLSNCVHGSYCLFGAICQMRLEAASRQPGVRHKELVAIVGAGLGPNEGKGEDGWDGVDRTGEGVNPG